MIFSHVKRKLPRLERVPEFEFDKEQLQPLSGAVLIVNVTYIIIVEMLSFTIQIEYGSSM